MGDPRQAAAFGGDLVSWQADSGGGSATATDSFSVRILRDGREREAGAQGLEP